MVSPAGPVYQAGTLSGNPIAMSAGYTMLKEIQRRPDIYRLLDEISKELVDGIYKVLRKYELPYTINHVGSMYSLFFTDKKVVDFETAKSADTILFGKYFNAMLKRGIYLAPSQFESLFLSAALKPGHVKRILKASKESLKEIHNL